MLILTEFLLTIGLIYQTNAALTKSNWRQSNKIARDLLPAGLTGDSYNAAMSAWQASAEAFVKGTQVLTSVTAPLQTTSPVAGTLQMVPSIPPSAVSTPRPTAEVQTYHTEATNAAPQTMPTAQAYQSAQIYQTVQTYQPSSAISTTPAGSVTQTIPTAQIHPTAASISTMLMVTTNEGIATSKAILEALSVPSINATFTTQAITKLVPIATTIQANPSTTTTSDTSTLPPPPGAVASPVPTAPLSSSSSSIINPYANIDWNVFTIYNPLARLTQLPTEVQVATPTTDFKTWTTSLSTKTWEKDVRPTDWKCNGCTISDGWKPERTFALVFDAQVTKTLGWSGRSYLDGRLFDFHKHTTASAVSTVK